MSFQGVTSDGIQIFKNRFFFVSYLSTTGSPITSNEIQNFKNRFPLWTIKSETKKKKVKV